MKTPDKIRFLKEIANAGELPEDECGSTCPDPAILIAIVEHERESDLALSFLRHVASCASCTDLFDRLNEFHNAASEMTPDADQDLAWNSTIRPRLELAMQQSLTLVEERTGGRPRAFRFFSSFPVGARLTLAGCVAVVIVGAVISIYGDIFGGWANRLAGTLVAKKEAARDAHATPDRGILSAVNPSNAPEAEHSSTTTPDRLLASHDNPLPDQVPTQPGSILPSYKKGSPVGVRPDSSQDSSQGHTVPATADYTARSSWSGETSKPSFNCANARTASERLICSDTALAAQEREMADAYNKVLQRLPQEQKAAFKREHGEWFADYARTCDSAMGDEDRRACITRYLSQHIRQLQKQIR